jgi:hypothetical protein
MYTDHVCMQKDHSLTYRVRNGVFAKIRIGFRGKGEQLHLKVHYDEGYSEVWTWHNSPRTRINQVVYTDFSDVPKLKDKIKTLLLFA